MYVSKYINMCALINACGSWSLLKLRHISLLPQTHTHTHTHTHTCTHPINTDNVCAVFSKTLTIYFSRKGQYISLVKDMYNIMSTNEMVGVVHVEIL
jgi:hypothetical protein